jgi:hypothetical protein
MAGTKHRTGAAPGGQAPAPAQVVVEGGIRPLGTLVEEPEGTFQPQVALWVEATSGAVLATKLIDPRPGTEQSLRDAVAALLAALDQAPSRRPRGTGKGTPTDQGIVLLHAPHPARVLVNDAALAAAVREALQPSDIPVELRASLPTFERAFAEISRSLGANPDGALPEPFSWDIDGRLLPPLFRAAAAFERAAPWEYLPDYPPVAVDLGMSGPEARVQTLYGSILGGGGEVYGAAFYYDPEGLRTHLREGMEAVDNEPEIDAALEDLRRSGAPIDAVPPEMLRSMVGGLLRRTGSADGQDGVGQLGSDPELPQGPAVDAIIFSLDQQDEADPAYVQWLADQRLGHKGGMVPTFFRSQTSGGMRDLNNREVRALTGALEALNIFFSRHRDALLDEEPPDEPLTITARIGTEKRTVMVTFPAPGFDWEEEDLPPATPEQIATLYRFRVTFRGQETIWRRIEMRGDQTLEDLHEAIQEAFGWDDDHLYAFFLSGRAWDDASEYSSPYGESERPTDQYRLAMLPLKPRQQFLYIFDFGDELRHLIKLEAITPGGVQVGGSYPRNTERFGETEPQYRGLAEEEDRDDDEDEDE